MPATLHVADQSEGVRVITLSHPERKNALDAAFFDALEAAMADGAGVRAWLVRAAGEGIFSAGYDLTALNGFPEGTPLPDERLGAVLDLISAHPAPSVALVTGPAIGAGCELAAACDFRVGNANARFVMPPAKVGVVYARKGLERLVSRVGEQAARRMFLLARPVEAEEALRLGLLDELAEDAELRAIAMCQELAGHAPMAVQGMKKGLGLLRGASEGERAEYERVRRASFNSEDAKEGKAALLEKRAPKFVGR